MRSALLALLVATGALASAGPARAEDDAAASVTVALENLDGPRARMSVEGRVSYLPDGALLHISLQVDGPLRPVEAGFFRVTVQGGRYGGVHEWKDQTFAPVVYRTEVQLVMEVQNPAVKRFLARELGYPGDHIAVVSVAQNVLGTEEERSAFMVETLRTLREFQQRAAALHGELVEKIQLAGDDPAFTAFEEGFTPRARSLHEALKTLKLTRVVWVDAAVFSALEHRIFQLEWSVHKHKQGDRSVPSKVAAAGDHLRRVLDDIDDRLPAGAGGGGGR
ncbi:MAG: hypothetical protein M9894_39230 [Planctomycetes bacterium]|nr:hypothetical protein [Planctomycetota bacterium]